MRPRQPFLGARKSPGWDRVVTTHTSHVPWKASVVGSGTRHGLRRVLLTPQPRTHVASPGRGQATRGPGRSSLADCGAWTQPT